MQLSDSDLIIRGDHLIFAGIDLAELADVHATPFFLYSERRLRTNIAELLGAIGLVLPPLTHIAPVLAPIAAIGVAVLQVGAGITHVRRKEYRMLSANGPLVVLAVVVAVLGFILF